MYRSDFAVSREPRTKEARADFTDEIPLYAQSGAFVELVRNLPLKPRSFHTAFVSVYEKLYQTGELNFCELLFFKDEFDF